MIEASFAHVTNLGDYSTLIGFAVLYGLLVRPGDLRVFGVVLVSIWVVTALKGYFAVSRPSTATIDGYSFPSGHATVGTATFLLVGLVEDRAFLVGLVLAVLVSISRVVIGVHRPIDVLVGFLLGATIATTAYAVSYRVPEVARD